MLCSHHLLGDWVADTAVARAGFPAMAISSTFGSPLLNCVIGIGMSLTYYCLSHFPQDFVFNFSDEKYDQVSLKKIFIRASFSRAT